MTDFSNDSYISNSSLIANLHFDIDEQNSKKVSQHALQEDNEGNLDFQIDIDQASYILSKPYDKRTREDLQMFINITQQLPFFNSFEDQNDNRIVQTTCAQYMKFQYVPKNQYVFKIDEPGSKFYIILQGTVSVHIRLLKQNTNNIIEQEDSLSKFIVLHPGQTFGEKALLEEKPRAASIYCEENCYFGVLEKQDYQKSLKVIESKKVNKILSWYRQIPGFHKITNNNILRQIQLNTTEIEFKKGQNIFEEGDDTKDSYIIVDGEFSANKFIKRDIQIQKDTPNFIKEKLTKSQQQQQVLWIFAKLDMFGEEDAIYKQKRQYTVTCNSLTGTLIKIHQENLLRRVLRTEGCKEYLKDKAKQKKKMYEERVQFLQNQLEKFHNFFWHKQQQMVTEHQDIQKLIEKRELDPNFKNFYAPEGNNSTENSPLKNGNGLVTLYKQKNSQFLDPSPSPLSKKNGCMLITVDQNNKNNKDQNQLGEFLQVLPVKQQKLQKKLNYENENEPRQKNKSQFSQQNSQEDIDNNEKPKNKIIKLQIVQKAKKTQNNKNIDKDIQKTMDTAEEQEEEMKKVVASGKLGLTQAQELKKLKQMEFIKKQFMEQHGNNPDLIQASNKKLPSKKLKFLQDIQNFKQKIHMQIKEGGQQLSPLKNNQFQVIQKTTKQNRGENKTSWEQSNLYQKSLIKYKSLRSNNGSNSMHQLIQSSNNVTQNQMNKNFSQQNLETLKEIDNIMNETPILNSQILSLQQQNNQNSQSQQRKNSQLININQNQNESQLLEQQEESQQQNLDNDNNFNINNNNNLNSSQKLSQNSKINQYINKKPENLNMQNVYQNILQSSGGNNQNLVNKSTGLPQNYKYSFSSGDLNFISPHSTTSKKTFNLEQSQQGKYPKLYTSQQKQNQQQQQNKQFFTQSQVNWNQRGFVDANTRRSFKKQNLDEINGIRQKVQRNSLVINKSQSTSYLQRQSWQASPVKQYQNQQFNILNENLLQNYENNNNNSNSNMTILDNNNSSRFNSPQKKRGNIKELKKYISTNSYSERKQKNSLKFQLYQKSLSENKQNSQFNKGNSQQNSLYFTDNFHNTNTILQMSPRNSVYGQTEQSCNINLDDNINGQHAIQIQSYKSTNNNNIINNNNQNQRDIEIKTPNTQSPIKLKLLQSNLTPQNILKNQRNSLLKNSESQGSLNIKIQTPKQVITSHRSKQKPLINKIFNQNCLGVVNSVGIGNTQYSQQQDEKDDSMVAQKRNSINSSFNNQSMYSNSSNVVYMKSKQQSQSYKNLIQKSNQQLLSINNSNNQSQKNISNLNINKIITGSNTKKQDTNQQQYKFQKYKIHEEKQKIINIKK